MKYWPRRPSTPHLHCRAPTPIGAENDLCSDAIYGLSRRRALSELRLPLGCHLGAGYFLAAQEHLVDAPRVRNALKRVGVEHDEIGAPPACHQAGVQLRDLGAVAGCGDD